MTTWPDQRVVEVADGVAAVLQGQGQAGVSNAGIVVDGDEALVVDTMTFPEMAQAIVVEVGRRRARPTVALNTHHHIDHIGGNGVLADTGARLVAHAETVSAIGSGGLPAEVYDAFMPAFRGEFQRLKLVVPEPLDGIDVPGRPELPTYAPAHTAADVAVWLAGPRVLFTGALCFFGVAPLAVQALVSGWVAALDALVALEPATVVPGHGPVGTVGDMVLVRDYLAAVLDTGRKAVEEGAELDDAVDAFDAGPVAEWVEAERTVLNIERAMQEARGEVGPGRLDAIPPSFARLLH